MSVVKDALAAAHAAGLSPALNPAWNGRGECIVLGNECPACGSGTATIEEHTASCTNGCAPEAILGALNLPAHGPEADGLVANVDLRELTDAGNADRLVDEHGDDLIYVPGIGWFVWRGDHWQGDPAGELMRRARLTVARRSPRSA